MRTFSWHEINIPLYESPSLHFSWAEWAQTARCAGLPVCWPASRGQVRGRGREARPHHHLVERRDPTHPRSFQASGKNKSRIYVWFIQSAHTSALIVSRISLGFNHTNVLIFHGWKLVSFQILQIATLINSDQNMHSISFSRLTFENVQFIPFYRQVLMEMWRWALYGSLPR